MAPWLVVAKREFLARVRTKWFVIVTVLGPIAMAALLVVPAWLAKRSAETETRIAVVDRSQRQIGDKITAVISVLGANIAIEEQGAKTTKRALQQQIRDKQIAGYLIIPRDVLTTGGVVYRGVNATNLGVVAVIREICNVAVQSARAIDAGIRPDQIARIMRPIHMQTYQTTGGAETSGEAVFVVAYATMFLLYMAVLLYAVNVLRSVIQEKSSRVIELLVASIKPRSLLVGKLLGVGSVATRTVPPLGLLWFRFVPLSRHAFGFVRHCRWGWFHIAHPNRWSDVPNPFVFHLGFLFLCGDLCGDRGDGQQ